MKRYSDLAGSEFEEAPEGEWVRFEDVEARVRELEAAWLTKPQRGKSVLPEVLALQSRLAAATALIKWLDKKGGLGLDVHDRLTDFLAGQPAAPAIRCYACGSDEPMDTHRCQRAAPTRTEAEQAVLAACAAATDEFLAVWSRAKAKSPSGIARAELARRGLKP